MSETKAATKKRVARDPDIVDALLVYLEELIPAPWRPWFGSSKKRLELALRRRFGGFDGYLRTAAELEEEMMAEQVLALFDGRNATEVARRLQISRAAVYRILKQPGGRKLSQVSPET